MLVIHVINAFVVGTYRLVPISNSIKVRNRKRGNGIISYSFVHPIIVGGISQLVSSSTPSRKKLTVSLETKFWECNRSYIQFLIPCCCTSIGRFFTCYNILDAKTE
ncbi:hypothetical protein RF11_13484 [Thelohanellus kitauei]|uniref:Uncharacterized protein n=1 Tax=Thelohanellus kitauei TaxID=669202 RepID=A0A0C2JQJ1_THEKT|nr:hypothetical protein RF11_13484 [Thelohanellus kitauei]